MQTNPTEAKKAEGIMNSLVANGALCLSPNAPNQPPALPMPRDLGSRATAMQDALSRIENRIETFGATSQRQLRHMAAKKQWQASTA